MKYVIIGGVAGGATTAARLRRVAEHSEIIIFERGSHISYANCGLPYYIGETITERDRLFVQTPENFKKTLNIDVRVRCEVIAINRDDKTVTVRNLDTGEEFAESYDKLVLSPGAEPVKPPIPGINSPGIFTLRSVPETDAIKEFVDTRHPRRAVIVGAGFIGLEMAENLHQRGVFVTIVEMAQQVMNVVDYEMAAQVHQHLKTKNVEFYLNDGVAAFETSGEAGRADAPGVIQLKLKSGRTIDADMVILSIGVRPESRLAKESGLDVGETGGIKVDEHLQTNDPDIYAVGDAIEFPNPVTGVPGITYLAGPANKQGRICADNMVFGNEKKYHGSIATAIAKVFDITVASTGVSEKTLSKAGIKFESIVTHSSNHAGYYPNAMPMSIKLLFDKSSGRVFGAQIVGYDGVDKRIDLIASVVRRGGTVEDLMELEHAYAPPYSSAKDPVNIAGFVAENVMRGRSRHVHWHEIQGCDQSEIQLIDVRSPEEFALGAIDGAVNIPHYEMRDRLDEVDKSRTQVVYCLAGLRAYQAERILRQNGFDDVYNLSGGYKTYEFAVQKQENEDIFALDVIGKDDSIYRASGRQPVADMPLPGGETPVGAAVAPGEIIELDAVGLQCPGPIIALKREMDKAGQGQEVRVVATDPGFARDVEAWCRMTRNTLSSLDQEGARITAVVRKSATAAAPAAGAFPAVSNGTTLVVFSDSLDRALATFVIANGAASAGHEVTLFFTFWGLSLLKKRESVRVRKDFMGRMFGWMLPSGTARTSLSKMNFGGMGAKMMRRRMKSKNIASLEEMIDSALESGVKLVACQMSMDMMGIAREELIDGVEIGGVATYLETASHGSLNLFV
jgi:NADPH-dependent 2,4-dienoyl-CoA reductase/sulfur reductase-like enzyme/peroxiredoxin family protein/rhodanese-related sulfurtransferase/TusA-related sulfurtransferase